jgi:hypothetical protein
MSVREYLSNLTIDELEYIKLLIEIDPTLTVLNLVEEIKRYRNGK